MANVFNLGFLEDERRRELGLYNPEEEYVLPEDLEDMEPVRTADAPASPVKDAGAASAAETPAAPSASGDGSAAENAAKGNPPMESTADAPAAAAYGRPRLLEPASDMEEEGPALYWPESGNPHRSRRTYSADEYYGMPRCGITELVHGRLCYMPLPDRRHQQLASALHYAISKDICEQGIRALVFAAPFAVNLYPAEGNTIVHPDLSVISIKEGAKERMDERGCKGAPDWILEIVSPANPVHDYYEKLMLYWKAGVREYWILNPMHKNVIVYSMGKEGGKFDLQAYHFEDKIRSSLFEGVCIDMGQATIAF